MLIVNIDIVDMDSVVGGITKAVFKEAEHIIVINKAGMFANEKMRMFANQGLVSENADKMFVIKNFVEKNASYNDDLKVPEIGRIRNYGMSDEKTILQVMSNELNLTSIL